MLRISKSDLLVHFRFVMAGHRVFSGRGLVGVLHPFFGVWKGCWAWKGREVEEVLGLFFVGLFRYYWQLCLARPAWLVCAQRPQLTYGGLSHHQFYPYPHFLLYPVKSFGLRVTLLIMGSRWGFGVFLCWFVSILLATLPSSSCLIGLCPETLAYIWGLSRHQSYPYPHFLLYPIKSFGRRVTLLMF